MRKNKKEVIESIEILDFAAEGKCIAKRDGEVIFVEGSNVAPGDIVKLLVSKKKKKYSEGTILEIIQKSPNRIEPFCEHFGVCGGCKWQHIPYNTQLSLKFQQVKDQLERIGKLELPEFTPILASDKTTFYRNKLEYTFSNSSWKTREEIATNQEISQNALGFHIPKRFEKVLKINKCFLQPDPSNGIRDFLREYVDAHNFSYYDHVAHEGFMRNIMIRTTSIGDIMVMVQFAQNNEAEIFELLTKMYEEFPTITSLNYVINSKRNDSFQDLEIITFKGKPYIEEKMEDLTFRIAAKSFYQTNSEQAFNLYKITREFAEIKPTDVVYDLYTGTGTIANFVAKQAKKVVGLEYVEDAVKDARINSEVNGIANTTFFAGDMRKLLTDEFVSVHGQPDIIITDPPRAGMDEPVIQTILNAAPKTIVYVSCNAATQARDLTLLGEKYKITKVQPVDMFPHTHHVENVVKLELKEKI